MVRLVCKAFFCMEDLLHFGHLSLYPMPMTWKGLDGSPVDWWAPVDFAILVFEYMLKKEDD
ncbi:hypothetical protein GCM10007416_09760 [Kroppenstedtia guangzhouensis]|uniref:Uncharacterized protein n=1 Tax=Kroppenstedtia guangzhouensis TaxID=1274356 RepID=A0ABQ1G8I0_9BACL|nr:hypothetical protein GCM10007416_09760 [Kroppenstedtia guangzhouensis]